MHPYLESVSLALGDLVLGDAAVEHVPSELVGVLPIVDQTNSTRTIYNRTIAQVKMSEAMKPRSSLDDLHGHLDVAPLGEFLHSVELGHERVPEPRHTQQSTATQTLRVTAPTHRSARQRKPNRVTSRNSQALEEGELGGRVEGGDGEVELVEQAQRLLDRARHLRQVLLRRVLRALPSGPRCLDAVPCRSGGGGGRRSGRVRGGVLHGAAGGQKRGREDEGVGRRGSEPPDPAHRRRFWASGQTERLINHDDDVAHGPTCPMFSRLLFFRFEPTSLGQLRYSARC